MNIPKLNQSIEILRNNLGESLIATTISVISDGLSIAGYNSNPTFEAVIVKLINVVNDVIKIGGMPELEKYATLDLQEDKLLVIIPLGEYVWGMILDSKKIKMGLLLNIEVPAAIEMFAEAIV